jgi:hypothetical protein
VDYSKLNAAHWRPILFEGAEFPPTVMAIAILGTVLGPKDRDLQQWLAGFADCRGTTKSAESLVCFQFASRARDLALEYRDALLTTITRDLASEGFEPVATLRDWMNALQQIIEIAAQTEDDCEWRAPSVAGEAAIVTKQIDAMRWFMDGQR